MGEHYHNKKEIKHEHINSDAIDKATKEFLAKGNAVKEIDNDVFGDDKDITTPEMRKKFIESRKKKKT